MGAKLWVDERDEEATAASKKAREIFAAAAKDLRGRAAFVVNTQSYSWELSSYGLNHPEKYPAFGVASNASYNAIKYGMEVEESFWDSTDAVAGIVKFVEAVLGG